MTSENGSSKQDSDKLELINTWFRIVLVSAITAVVLFKIIISPINLSTFDFSDFLSVFAITISILSLFITIYFQFLKPPSLKLIIGGLIGIFLSEKNGPIFHTNLTFFNLGPKYVGIVNMFGVISQENRTIPFEWNSFIKDKNLAEPGKAVLVFHDFDSYPETIVVPGYQAITKSIQFETSESFSFTSGDCVIEFTAIMIPNSRRPIKQSIHLTLTSDNVTYLSERCKIHDGTTKDTLKIRLIPN